MVYFNYLDIAIISPLAVIFIIILFLVVRAIKLWYWRINDLMDRLESMNMLLGRTARATEYMANWMRMEEERRRRNG